MAQPESPRSKIEDVRGGQPGQQHARKESDDGGEEPAQRDPIDRLVVVAREQRTPQCYELQNDGQCEKDRRQDRGNRPSAISFEIPVPQEEKRKSEQYGDRGDHTLSVAAGQGNPACLDCLKSRLDGVVGMAALAVGRVDHGGNIWLAALEVGAGSAFNPYERGSLAAVIIIPVPSSRKVSGLRPSTARVRPGACSG